MNLYNGGRVAFYDGFYYYGTSNGIWKFRFGEKMERIFKGKGLITHINIADGWLYALHEAKQNYGEIIKINLSKPREVLRLNKEIFVGDADSSRSRHLQLYDGWLYYTNAEKKIYQMRADGSNAQELGKGLEPSGESLGYCMIHCFIQNHSILYDLHFNKNSDKVKLNGIYSANLANGNVTQLFQAESFIYSHVIYEDKIFYTRYEEPYEKSKVRYQVYSSSVDGKVRNPIGNPVVFYNVLNIWNGYIYYIQQDLKGKSLCKMRTDGTDIQVIRQSCELGSAYELGGILVFDDWIFIDRRGKWFEADKGILAVSHDGKQTQEL